ncbi:hypothetical protein [uncultured Celeribacter sp.]|uniref:hypothetical protein n=1 Tax=uncultured Celeribacter sp. TaxID=1303376 RepID=UPI002AA62680|nr:hypothetical protein [uncultured Celeribacter sp.]
MTPFGRSVMVMVGMAPLMAMAAEIQPTSGLWQGQATLLGQDGCPPQMVDQMPGAFSENANYGPQKITFPDPFTPESLAGDFTWVRVSENHWQATFQESTATGVGVLVTDQSIDLYVRSETELEQFSRLQVTFPAAMAQMMGTSAPCVVSSRVDHRYVGP